MTLAHFVRCELKASITEVRRVHTPVWLRGETYSYGIPVGSSASRLIAELTIADIDQLLLSGRRSIVRLQR
jgi:hypothetical protein